ncbi:putative ferredoxin-like protein YdhY [bacterium BMS3Bbin14]|nr:putative ferredoxin-like protein YdhY [bacterium BMS3Abin13]GBE52741.1 putative ferredoxin-like protein YdhY [bacterium BMS3Bbin14]HDL98062.1 4Fe-4S dicluster domain-containing protein [Desulfobacteraceae bacterium]HDO29499.1 4Fe-4S dicluster domain-containing protein [Desulfobacteraceae bacterium]
MYTRIYFLRFPKETSDQPIIYYLVKRYDVEFNILKADILPQREGIMIIEFKGNRENIREALSYLKDLEVQVERLAGKVSRDDEKCFQCGACTGICPVGALYMQRPEMAVLFDPDRCSGCGLCVTACPVRAMTVSFDQVVVEEF